MAEYIRKPEQVEAIRFEKPWKNVKAFSPSIQLVHGTNNEVVFAMVRSGRDQVRAEFGDWFVKTRMGGVLLVRADQFDALFEPLRGSSRTEDSE